MKCHLKVVTMFHVEHRVYTRAHSATYSSASAHALASFHVEHCELSGFKQFVRSGLVPRETSCICFSVLLSFRPLGVRWRGSLRWPIRRAVWAKRPPPST